MTGKSDIRNEPNDVQIMKYLDGEGEQDIMAHIEGCSRCQERIQQLKQEQGRLVQNLFRSTCPTSLELGEYALRLLPQERSQIVAEHLKSCPHCTEDLSTLRQFLSDLSGDLELSLGERLRVIVANLVGGERPAGLAPAFQGLRGDEPAGAVYEAEGYQVHLDVQADPEQPALRSILGLVLGQETQALGVYLWREAQLAAASPVDEYGNFVLAQVEPGQYELALRGPEVEIRIEALEV